MRSSALSSGDVDNDGFADLLVGYWTPSGGLVAVHRTNPDSIVPPDTVSYRSWVEGNYDPPPFDSPIRTYAVPSSPDFLEVEDFNGDGQPDLLVASRDSDLFYLPAGDGSGGLLPAQEKTLPGIVTALTSGETNRADGAADFVVGIAREDGFQVLVFEDPKGAWQADPEELEVAEAVGSLAVGNLDSDYWRDVAVASGDMLHVFHGRDRRLSLSQEEKSAVFPPPEKVLALDSKISSLVVGDLQEDSASELALLLADGAVRLLEFQTDSLSQINQLPILQPRRQGLSGETFKGKLLKTRVSLLGKDDLILFDPRRSRVTVLAADEREETKVSKGDIPLWRKSTLSLPQGLVGVTSLRVNPTALQDLAFLGSALDSLMLASPQGQETFTVTDGGDPTFFCNGDKCLARFQLQGDGDIRDKKCAIPPCEDGECTGPCTLRAALEQANTVGGAIINFDVENVEASGGPFPGVGAPVHLLGDTGSRVGIKDFGIFLEAGNNTLQGLRLDGSFVTIRSGSSGSLVEGNWFGLTAEGAGVGTELSGLTLAEGASGNTVGARSPMLRNQFGSLARVLLADASGNEIVGNWFGLNSQGLSPGTSDGIRIDRGANNLVEINIVANARVGIDILNSSANRVFRNFVGTDATGQTAAGTSHQSILVSGTSNTIGGQSDTLGNVLVSGERGITVCCGSSNTTIQGNWIGVTHTDLAPAVAPQGAPLSLGHAEEGIMLFDGTGAGTQIGCDQPPPSSVSQIGCGNAIGFNGTTTSAPQFPGISLNESATVMGNLIFSNFSHGVGIRSNDNLVARNTVRENVRAGVFVESGTRNTIRANHIDSNGGLGIDLAPSGVTPNDDGDPEPDPPVPPDQDAGANDLQNHPVVVVSEDGATVNVVLHSTPKEDFRVELFLNTACDPRGAGEGEEFIDSVDVRTSDLGLAEVILELDPPINPTEEFITATATQIFAGGALRSTSEFSPCSTLAPAPVIVVNSTGDAELKEGASECDTGGQPVQHEGESEPECTLRAALQFVDGARRSIRFDIPGEGPPVIQPQTKLPDVPSGVDIDAHRIEGEFCWPSVALDGSFLEEDSFGLILTGASSEVRGLALYGFDEGIRLAGEGRHQIRCSFIGLRLDYSRADHRRKGIALE